ncbi:fumarylacetoacetate hydrolase family protein [Marinibacterium sp. SX1]|uniref:fumarylacetoacetate hydrolase family protein n=1 Tax=Marinibacterium sp. SX1 TaxID=3388424 RepID=UPI003D163164
MMRTLFELPEIPVIPVTGQDAGYPIGRIFCVGRNYAAHAAEMGFEVDREAPFYFTKSPAAAVLTGASVPYPPGTENYHYEMEMAIAIGAPVFRASRQEALAAIHSCGCALDMTRRDLQIRNREKGRPWSLGKDVEGSAVFAPLTPIAEMGEIGPQRIHLAVNGETRQDGTLAELIWKLEEIVMDLSGYYHLRPGDLIMTGTPAGVGPVAPGDVLTGGVDGLEPISLTITAPE